MFFQQALYDEEDSVLSLFTPFARDANPLMHPIINGSPFRQIFILSTIIRFFPDTVPIFRIKKV